MQKAEQTISGQGIVVFETGKCWVELISRAEEYESRTRQWKDETSHRNDAEKYYLGFQYCQRQSGERVSSSFHFDVPYLPLSQDGEGAFSLLVTPLQSGCYDIHNPSFWDDREQIASHLTMLIGDNPYLCPLLAIVVDGATNFMSAYIFSTVEDVGFVAAGWEQRLLTSELVA